MRYTSGRSFVCCAGRSLLRLLVLRCSFVFGLRSLLLSVVAVGCHLSQPFVFPELALVRLPRGDVGVTCLARGLASHVQPKF